MSQTISDIILKEWCSKLPRGFPAIVNNQFSSQDELAILKEIIHEKLSSGASDDQSLGEKLKSYVKNLLHLRDTAKSYIEPLYGIKKFKDFYVTDAKNLKTLDKTLSNFESVMDMLRKNRTWLEDQAEIYDDEKINKILDLTRTIDSHLEEAFTEYDIYAGFANKIKEISSLVGLKQIKSNSQLEDASGVPLQKYKELFKNDPAYKRVRNNDNLFSDITAHETEYNLLNKLPITEENFDEYCSIKLGKDSTKVVSILRGDKRILPVVLKYINSKQSESLKLTIDFINKTRGQSEAFRTFTDLSGGTGAGVENMGRGEIPIITLMKKGLKSTSNEEGDIAIDGAYYEVKEGASIRAGTTFKPSTSSLIRSILGLHEMLKENKAMAKFIGSHPKFIEELKKDTRLAKFANAKDAWKIWLAIVSQDEDVVTKSNTEVEGEDAEITQEYGNLNTIGATKIKQIASFIRAIIGFKSSVDQIHDKATGQSFAVKDKRGGRDPKTGRRRLKTFSIDEPDMQRLQKTPIGKEVDLDVTRVTNDDNYRSVENFVNKIDLIIPSEFSLEKIASDLAKDFIKPYDGLIYLDTKRNYYLFTQEEFLNNFKFVSISQMTRPQFKFRG